MSRLVTRFSSCSDELRFLAPYRRPMVMGASQGALARGMVCARYGSTRSPSLYGPHDCGG